ncbi:MAG: WYL domain-containing protein [Candidatus Oceanisphaera merdipullorum]|nr:WYL domain-containing protein [Candidatus Oceanisphaera merdipullorum]
MSDSTLRTLLLLQNIPREPHFISSQALLSRVEDAGFQASLRTIQRDLSNLSALFPLIQNEPQGRGKTGVGWAFTRDSQRMGFPGMDAVTALTLSMAMQHLRPLLPPQVLQHLQPLQYEAEERLAKHNSASYQHWVNKVRVVPSYFLQPPQADAEAVELIYQALLENRQFCATYRGKAQRVIHPYGLVQQDHTLYLLCRFYQFDDIRVTALHRYQQVQLLADPVRPFSEFKIDDYLDKGALRWLLPEQQPLLLKLRLPDWMAEHITESPISTMQRLTVDDHHANHYILEAQVLDSMQFRRWILSQSDGLLVLEPASLRDWVKDTLKNQLHKYQ